MEHCFESVSKILNTPVELSSLWVTSLFNPKNFLVSLKTYRRFLATCLILGVSVFGGCEDPDKADNGVLFDVGIYSGPGTHVESLKACFSAVKFAGFTCDTLTLNEISGSTIGRFAAILFPGGDAQLYSEALGPVGRGKVRRYVADGGGFIGFGGGGALAASDSGSWPGIGLMPGTSRYPSGRIVANPYRGGIEIERGSSPGLIAKGLRYQTLYNGGPEFFPVNSLNLTVDYIYYGVGSSAAVGGEYGFGQFWLTGFQPEFEEGSSRDGTTFGDDYADIDSEWELIEAALLHCVTYANRL